MNLPCLQRLISIPFTEFGHPIFRGAGQCANPPGEAQHGLRPGRRDHRGRRLLGLEPAQQLLGPNFIQPLDLFHAEFNRAHVGKPCAPQAASGNSSVVRTPPTSTASTTANTSSSANTASASGCEGAKFRRNEYEP